MARLTLLGVEVDPFTIQELNATIAVAGARGERWIIAHHNLHSVYLYHRDSRMRNLYAQARVIYIDGMPILLFARLLGYPLRREHRITCVDWIHPLMQEAARKGWRVFYLGGKPGVAECAAGTLRKQYPETQIATHYGYFRPEENERILDTIAAYRPHVLMVGMGMPRQEHWIPENLEQIHANVIIAVGACFDYIAEAIPTPPRWMGRMGLEWLYRLWSEPTRLAWRYLIEPWFLVPFMPRDILNRCLALRSGHK